MTELPRGLRNNNPGNLRFSPDHWQGEIAGTDPDFVTFEDITHGIRAAAIIFLNYSRLRGLSTIAQYVSRWAPSNDSGSTDNNPTTAYVNYVATACGADPNNSFNLEDAGNLSKLLDAVFQFENGGCYVTLDQITAGVDAALNISSPPTAQV